MFPDHAHSDVSTEVIRNGYKLLYRGSEVGRLTMWVRGIGTNCKIEGRWGCRLPAQKPLALAGDYLLQDWLLQGIDFEGKPRLTKEEHAAVPLMIS